MSDNAIVVRNLSKVFRIWRKPSDMLLEGLTGRRLHSDFQALADVSFEVRRGSVFGVLGRNGAGKSTLLRIVAGTLDSTSGSAKAAGRIAAILELGTGFHPEYSGRENVYLGGLCLGLSRADINARFDEIVAFAELEDFIDQPFRTFSSGMQARLTFAVATSVDPDVLIIDEALAVGDARFTLKSFDRIRDFARRGKSILFVSHDINQVMTFCDEALVLEHGRIFAKGDPQKVGNIYHELLFGNPNTPAAPTLAFGSEAPVEDSEPRIAEFYIRNEAGQRVTRLKSVEKYEIVASMRAGGARSVPARILFRTPRGVDVYSAGFSLAADNTGVAKAIGAFRNNLAPGNYFVTATLLNAADGGAAPTETLEIAVDPEPGVYTNSLANLQMRFSIAEAPAAAADRATLSAARQA